MSNTRPTFGHSRKPPSLMDLVYEYGRYDLIPPEAWAEYQRQMKEYRADMQSGALWVRLDEKDPSEKEDKS